MAKAKKTTKTTKKVGKVKSLVISNEVLPLSEAEQFYIQSKYTEMSVEELATKLGRSVEEINDYIVTAQKNNPNFLKGFIITRNGDGSVGSVVYTKERGIVDDRVAKQTQGKKELPGITRLGVITKLNPNLP